MLEKLLRVMGPKMLILRVTMAKPSKPLVVPPKKSQQNINDREKPNKDNINTREVDGNKLDKKSIEIRN